MCDVEWLAFFSVSVLAWAWGLLNVWFGCELSGAAVWCVLFVLFLCVCVFYAFVCFACGAWCEAVWFAFCVINMLFACVVCSYACVVCL